jgi:hypothetical protein
MPTKYPNGMRSMQWRRTPFRVRHRPLAFAINNALGHWRSCADRRAVARAAVRITNAIGGAWSK